MKNINEKQFDEFLDGSADEGTVCDLDGNCVQKHIKRDKSIVERVSKKIIIEDGRQLLM
jgi:hypothetical protein